MKYIMVLSAAAALWLLSAIEQGIAGAWADWCLFGILLWWTSIIVRIEVSALLDKKRR